MSGLRNFFAVRYTPVAGGGSGGVGRFLRYLHYRDRIRSFEDTPDVGGFLNYIAYRDRASCQSRLFDATGTVGKEQRQALASYIERSMEATRQAGGPRSSTNNRACYDLLISPEDAAGIDLRRVTQSALDRLEQEAGNLPPWIAAEHRNTKHPHVHVVLAARREMSSGKFRTVLLTKSRVKEMKAAAMREMTRQREDRQSSLEAAIEVVGPMARLADHDRELDSGHPDPAEVLAWSEHAPHDPRLAQVLGFSASATVAQIAGRLARRYRREAEREARRRGYASAREQRERENGQERAA